MWNRCPLCWDALGLGTRLLRTKQGNGKPVTLPWRNLADPSLARGSGGTLSRMSCWHQAPLMWFEQKGTAPLNSPPSPQLSLIRQIQTEEHSTAYIADTLQKSLETMTGWKRQGQHNDKMQCGILKQKEDFIKTKNPTNKTTQLENLSEVCSLANKNHLEQVMPSFNDQPS